MILMKFDIRNPFFESQCHTIPNLNVFDYFMQTMHFRSFLHSFEPQHMSNVKIVENH